VVKALRARPTQPKKTSRLSADTREASAHLPATPDFNPDPKAAKRKNNVCLKVRVGGFVLVNRLNLSIFGIQIKHFKDTTN